MISKERKRIWAREELPLSWCITVDNAIKELLEWKNKHPNTEAHLDYFYDEGLLYSRCYVSYFRLETDEEMIERIVHEERNARDAQNYIKSNSIEGNNE